jgi:hypothetical protein
MGLELEKGLKLFFFNFFEATLSFILLQCFFFLVFALCLKF